jgi:hypothetical protein
MGGRAEPIQGTPDVKGRLAVGVDLLRFAQPPTQEKMSLFKEQSDPLAPDALKANGFKLLRRDLCGEIGNDGRKCARQIEIWRGRQGQILTINISPRAIHRPTCFRQPGDARNHTNP